MAFLLMNYINSIVGINHFLVVFTVLIPLLLILSNLRVPILNQIIKYSIIINLTIFYPYLFYSGYFNYKVHFPLHLCYLTEVFILISIFTKVGKIESWILLNSMFGGLVGFVNSNLTNESIMIEFFHFYISHFNLLLFVIIKYKLNRYITIKDLLHSIRLNLYLLFIISIFNVLFSTNYWFTLFKPDGVNLSNLFPEWPYYIFILIFLGLISYSFTFIFFIQNRLQR